MVQSLWRKILKMIWREKRNQLVRHQSASIIDSTLAPYALILSVALEFLEPSKEFLHASARLAAHNAVWVQIQASTPERPERISVCRRTAARVNWRAAWIPRPA